MEEKKYKIMLVDESENLRCVLKDYLEMEGYNVVDFSSTDAASKNFNVGLYDICILDVATSGGKDGFELLQEIRRIDGEVPVIILTAKATKEWRIKGFKLGCDDYVAKPFSLEELELRVAAILKRCKVERKDRPTVYEEQIYKLGNFTFNYSALELIHVKGTRTLTRKEADLLKLLADHKNKLLPRDIILKEVWGDEEPNAGRSMDVFITKLRSYLQIDDEEYILPKEPGRRKIRYRDNYEPLVEIVNAHGTGFSLRVK